MAAPVRDPRNGSASSVKRKVTLYFNATMLGETQREAIRQDRSISWIIQAAWRLAREEVRRLPTAARVDGDMAAAAAATAVPPGASTSSAPGAQDADEP